MHSWSVQPSPYCLDQRKDNENGKNKISLSNLNNEEKEEVTIFAVNRNTKENVAFDADLRGFVDYRLLEYSVMEQEDMKAVNLLNKETVRPVSKTTYRFEDGKFETVLGKCSWNVIRFGK